MRLYSFLYTMASEEKKVDLTKEKPIEEVVKHENGKKKTHHKKRYHEGVMIKLSGDDLNLTAAQIFERAMNTGKYEEVGDIDVYTVNAEDAKTMTTAQVIEREEKKT
jgi:hypothetical protein